MSDSEILLIDGIEHSLWSSKKEDELEKSVKFHSKQIFGPDSIYFDIKRNITTSAGLKTVPDAYLIDFVNEAFYIIEIELSAHPEYDHINRQIGRFIGALGNYKTRQKIGRILKEYIDEDIVRKKFVSDKIGNRELYQFFLEDILEKVKEQNYHTIVVIDKITKNISEACNILSPRPKILEFRTYVRKNVGDLRVHCHLFKPLISEKIKIEKVYPPDISPPGILSKPVRVDYTGKKPVEVKLFNETSDVKHWRDVFLAAAEILIKKNPAAFNALADTKIMKGETRTYLSKDKSLVYSPHQLSNGLFLEVNLSANTIYRLIIRLLKGCGYEETEIEIFVKD